MRSAKADGQGLYAGWTPSDRRRASLGDEDSLHVYRMAEVIDIRSPPFHFSPIHEYRLL